MTSLPKLSVHTGPQPAALWLAKSCDKGVTWKQNPVPGPVGAWSVFPRLLQLHGGAIVITSGRPGLGLWVNQAGDAGDFEFISVPKVHNSLLNDTTLHYRPEYAAISNMHNNSQFGPQSDTWKFGESAMQSSGYTSLTEVEPDVVLYTYDRLAQGWACALPFARPLGYSIACCLADPVVALPPADPPGPVRSNPGRPL